MKCPGIDDDTDTNCENQIEDGTSMCASCAEVVASILARLAEVRKEKESKPKKEGSSSWDPQRTMYRVAYPGILALFVMFMEMMGALGLVPANRL